jgi:hypothetical protein
MLYDVCLGLGGGECGEFSVAKSGGTQGTGLHGLGWFVPDSCCFGHEILGERVERRV